jgi:hypothetical protein
MDWYKLGTVVFFLGLISFLIIQTKKLNKKENK